MNRKHEQAELLTALGALLGPVLRIADNPGAYDSDERARAIARFCHDVDPFMNQLQSFARGEPGHNYEQLGRTSLNRLTVLRNKLNHGEEAFLQGVRDAYAQIRDLITSVPIPIESAIHESHSPYSTYCLVRDICTAANERIIWGDRYFDQRIFGFFAGTALHVSIELVTWPRNKCRGERDQRRYDAFVQVSQLFEQERGRDNYRLVTHDEFHARYLLVDQQPYHLGDSIKELWAGTGITLSKLDAKDRNRNEITELVASAEAFDYAQNIDQ